MRAPLWLLLVGTVLIVVGINLIVYRVTDTDCRARGGHTEIIFGRHLSWVCDGASR